VGELGKRRADGRRRRPRRKTQNYPEWKKVQMRKEVIEELLERTRHITLEAL
jgi:hypothetical protein